MTQIKRTPKKMRRRMKGGGESIDIDLEKQVKSNIEVERNISKLQENIVERERQKIDEENENRRLQEEDVEKESLVKKEIEQEILNAEELKQKKEEEIKQKKVDAENERLEKEKTDRLKEKQLTLVEAEKQWEKSRNETGHGIICRMSIPKIYDKKDRNGSYLDQINEFSKYKLNKTLTPGPGEDTIPGQEGDAEQKADGLVGNTDAARTLIQMGDIPPSRAKDGLLNLSKITLDIIMGSSETQTLGKEYLNKTLLYFHTIQPLMDYIQEDFDDMKKLIEDIKGNKILKIDGRQEQADFIKLYNGLIKGNAGPLMVAEEHYIRDLYKEFTNASYITFNSNDLSTPEDISRKEVINTCLFTDMKTALPIKRQYLLEFISYIYITRKNDMESYLYYIEKIGDLTQYNPKKLHEEVGATTEGVEEVEEVESELPDSESTYSESTEAPSPAPIGGGYGDQYDKRRRTPVKRR